MEEPNKASDSVLVAVRCRPPSVREQRHPDPSIVSIDAGLVAVAHPEDGAASRHFSFDHTYDAHATQAELYRDLGAPLLAKAVDGGHATIFAYGQTGAGK